MTLVTTWDMSTIITSMYSVGYRDRQDENKMQNDPTIQK